MNTKYTKIELPNFDYEFENYWYYRRGGYKIDKRTREGKSIVDFVTSINPSRCIEIGNMYNIHPAMIYTSIRVRNELFTFPFIN
jgi:hypothetical protein